MTPDLHVVTIAQNSAQDIADYPVTSQMLRVRVSPGRICIDHTKRGKWPEETAPSSGHGDPLEGSFWAVAEIDGELHTGTFEWARPGQECKALASEPPSTEIGDQFAGHIKQGPLASWRPQPGERVWFFMSTIARNNDRSRINERSDLAEIIWPQRGESVEWIRGEEKEPPDDSHAECEQRIKYAQDGWDEAVLELEVLEQGNTALAEEWNGKAAKRERKGGKKRLIRAEVYRECARRLDRGELSED